MTTKPGKLISEFYIKKYSLTRDLLNVTPTHSSIHPSIHHKLHFSSFRYRHLATRLEALSARCKENAAVEGGSMSPRSRAKFEAEMGLGVGVTEKGGGKAAGGGENSMLMLPDDEGGASMMVEEQALTAAQVAPRPTLKEYLKCAICFDLLATPVNFVCGHTRLVIIIYNYLSRFHLFLHFFTFVLYSFLPPPTPTLLFQLLRVRASLPLVYYRRWVSYVSQAVCTRAGRRPYPTLPYPYPSK